MDPKQISSLPEGLCRQFSIDDILAATHEFSDSLVIGQGGFAKVYKGEIDNGSRTVAVKKLKSMTPELRKEFRDEILMVSKFRHSHLVSMLGYCETDDEMILVYEYVAGGTLYENLHKLGRDGSSNSVPLCWIERLKISIGVARGLDYLHTGTGINNKVIHRDIKSSNILLDQNRTTAKITDFGLSKIGPENQLDTRVFTRVMGTIGYMDPAYSSSGLLTSKSDVYAFGVVLFELLSGRPAVDSKLDYSQRGLAGWARVCVRKGRVEKIIDPSLKSEIQPRSLSKYAKIAERCLNERPRERPTMTEVLAELVLALSLQETGKQNGSTFSEKLLEFLSVKPRPISGYVLKDKLAMHVSPGRLNVHLNEDVEPRISRMLSIRSGVDGAQVAAGWPAWLTAVAGEAIKGWVPRKAESFMKLDKIGQGICSNVYKGRDTETGKVVALKRVRVDIMDPQSLHFMAREILILRRLDHDNVMKLKSLITSKVSASLYLVFEYMEHDLAGLSASPKIRFTQPQIKCYMQQLLRGLEHCHSCGVVHRDIKGSSILIGDNGNLRIGGFGLATFFHANQKQTLTSHVRTLWYRPPELLLGATDYGVAVDLWSVGCILAELYIGKPILPGRTEAEQLHMIFKLCGSPSEEYWKHTANIKPHYSYKRCVAEMLKAIPSSTLSLIDNLLAIEPELRGSTSSALQSDFFKTMLFPCDPSSLPKYPPSKEIDFEIREEEIGREIAALRNGHLHKSNAKGTRISRAGT